jgi:hypothetical protein
MMQGVKTVSVLTEVVVNMLPKPAMPGRSQTRAMKKVVLVLSAVFANCSFCKNIAS